MLLEQQDPAVGTLHQLREMGVVLCIDDFGTGYSSLNYLHNFPLNTLKIDRSFVSQLTGTHESTEIVQTIVMLARSLGMGVVAEGIETETQLASLQALECEGGQGYLFAKPMHAQAVEDFLSDAFSPRAEARALNSAPQRQHVLAV